MKLADESGQNNDPRTPVVPSKDLDNGMEGPFEGEYLDEVNPDKIREKMEEVERGE